MISAHTPLCSAVFSYVYDAKIFLYHDCIQYIVVKEYQINQMIYDCIDVTLCFAEFNNLFDLITNRSKSDATILISITAFTVNVTSFASIE